MLLAQTGAGRPQAYRESIAGTVVSFEMVPVPGGTVTIDGQAVEVKPFLIGRTEVTWDMYRRLCARPRQAAKAAAARMRSRARRSRTVRPTTAGVMPATRRSACARPAAQAFAEWLSTKTGKKYRLPTEAEWAHAAALAAGKTA